MKLLRVSTFLFMAAWPAWGATLAVTPGSGALLNGVYDSGTAFSPRHLVCDATNPDTCAPVSASNGLTVSIAGALSLPTGAATEATLGKLTLGQGSTTSAQTGPLVLGAVTSGLPTYTTGQSNPLSLQTDGSLRVAITAGGGGTSTFGAAFPAGGLAIGAKNGASMVNLAADGSSNLNVNCAVGCSGGTFNNNADNVATSATNGAAAAWLYAFDGATWDRLRVDGSANLNVNCAVGCVAGTFSNASDAVATSSNNSASLGFGYGFNGTTWDRLQVDGSKSLKVSVLGGIGAVETGGNLATIAGAVTASIVQSNTKQVNGVTTLAGAGAVGTGSQRVAVGQDTTTIAGSAPGTAGAASANVVTVQGVASGTPLATSTAPMTSGGLSTFSAIVANNTTSVAVKASAGQLYGIDAFSASATSVPIYIKLYDTAQGSVTCGTPTPKARYIIPSSGGSAGSDMHWHDTNGVAFATAVTVCITQGFNDNDTTAPAAGTYSYTMSFK